MEYTKIPDELKRKIKPLEELTLMDDYMFGAVMRDEGNLKPLLEYILKMKIRKIEFVEPQKTEKEGYCSRGIRLDLYVEDDEGAIYNVEVQTTSYRHLPKRMRYYQSVIDINILAPSVDYRNLRRSFVIFICNYDPFEQERYIYTFENRCLEDLNLAFGDDTLKVIVNTKGSVGEISDELKEVLIYLDEGTATGEYTKQLDEAVKLVKSSEERRHEYMIMALRDLEKIAEGEYTGKILGAVETMRDFDLDDQAIIERIMKKYDLDRDEAEAYVLPKPAEAV